MRALRDNGRYGGGRVFWAARYEHISVIGKNGKEKVVDKINQNVVKIPEIVAGYDIDWSAYVPSGGYEFAKLFDSVIKPALVGARSKAQDYIARMKDVANRRESVLTGLDRAVSAAREMLDFACMYSSLVTEDGRKNIAKFNAVMDIMSLSNNFHFEDDIAERIKTAENDIVWVSAVEKYFELDSEADKVLYAMHLVPARYRVKLFRHALKLIACIEKDHAIVISGLDKGDVETSAIRRAVEHLWSCYQALKPEFKEMKKQSEKHGIGFWEYMESRTPRSLRSTRPCAIFSPWRESRWPKTRKGKGNRP